MAHIFSVSRPLHHAKHGAVNLSSEALGVLICLDLGLWSRLGVRGVVSCFVVVQCCTCCKKAMSRLAG